MSSLTTIIGGVVVLLVGITSSFVVSPIAGRINNTSKRTIELVRRVMPDLERRRATRVELHTSLADIPPGDDCALCHAHMERTYLEYLSGGKHKILAKNTAGYKCSVCGIEEMSSSALLEAFKIGYDLMASQGHSEEAKSFREAIAFELSLRSEDAE